MKCAVRRLGFVAFISLSAAGQVAGDDRVPSVEKVRLMLNGSQFKADRYRALIELGDVAFPAYETIIADPKSEPAHVARSFGVISQLKTDRRRFIELTRSRLADPDDMVRWAALDLLEEIGGERDTAPVVALLSDADAMVRTKAAKSLAKIGGKRDLDAMDEWLKNGKHPKDGDYMIHVKKCRDELEKRVKENPIPKSLMN